MNNQRFSLVGIILFLILFSPIADNQVNKRSVFASTLQPISSKSIAGWEKFEGKNIELWLPKSYEGGNLDEDIDVITGNMRRLGSEFEQMAQIIEQNKDLYVLWAFDSELGSSGFLTNVTVTSEPVISAVTLEVYLDAVAKQLPPQLEILDRDLIALENYQAGQLITRFVARGREGKQVTYIIKQGNTIWTIAYTTGIEEFEQRSRNFQRSINSLVIMDN